MKFAAKILSDTLTLEQLEEIESYFSERQSQYVSEMSSALEQMKQLRDRGDSLMDLMTHLQECVRAIEDQHRMIRSGESFEIDVNFCCASKEVSTEETTKGA